MAGIRGMLFVATAAAVLALPSLSAADAIKVTQTGDELDRCPMRRARCARRSSRRG